MVQLSQNSSVVARNTLPKPFVRRERTRLRRILKFQRGSVGELAKALGVSQGAVSNWLSGRMDSRRIAEAVVARCEEIAAERAADRGQHAA